VYEATSYTHSALFILWGWLYKIKKVLLKKTFICQGQSLVESIGKVPGKKAATILCLFVTD